MAPQALTAAKTSSPLGPLQRSFGSIDGFVGQTEAPHLGDEAATGIDIDVRGWIFGPRSEPVAAAWVEVAGVTVPVELDRVRPDVAAAHSLRDRQGSGIGFETVIRLPHGIQPGIYDAHVIGKTKESVGVRGDRSRLVRIAQAPVVYDPAEYDSADPPYAMRPTTRKTAIRVSDTSLGSYTLGRGRHNIRQEASMRLNGQISNATTVRIIAKPPAGSILGWEYECGPQGNFDVALWTGGLERGLYPLTVTAIDEAGVETIGHLSIDIVGPHHLPPMHLNNLRTPPDAAIIHFADAGVRDYGAMDKHFVAGRPIGVAGWALDPVARLPLLAVFLQIDDLRPVPISSGLADPRVVASNCRCGFGGTVDTARIEPGIHTFRVLGSAVSGAGWYIIDERQVELDDHRIT